MLIRTLLALVLLQGVAVGWSGAGHRVVAIIAYNKLDPATRTKVLDILAEHPRFEREFEDEMPSGLSELDEGRWIFSQAAVWPDIARGYPAPLRAQFHRATWHYINSPIFLNEEAKDLDPSGINLETDLLSDMESPQFNSIQALKWNARVAGDGSAPDTKRAVALCWLFHDTGDINRCTPLRCWRSG